MREMGELSGVAIEPLQQTELLNDCLAVTGVIAGGVPGGISISPTMILSHAHSPVFLSWRL